MWERLFWLVFGFLIGWRLVAGPGVNWWIACFVGFMFCVYFAVEFGWGGGDKKDGHPPWPMA